MVGQDACCDHRSFFQKYKDYIKFWTPIICIPGILIGIASRHYKPKPEPPEQVLALEPLTVRAANGDYAVIVGKQDNGEVIACTTDINQLWNSLALEAVVQSEINDGDNETITLRGKLIPSEKDKTYFRFTSVTAQGYSFPPE